MVSCSVSASPLSEFVWSLAACFAWKKIDFEMPAFDSWLQDIFDQPNGTADGSAAKRPVGTIMCNLKGDQYQSETSWVFWAGLCIAQKTCYKSSYDSQYSAIAQAFADAAGFPRRICQAPLRVDWAARCRTLAQGQRMESEWMHYKVRNSDRQTFLKPRCCNQQCRNTMCIYI